MDVSNIYYFILLKYILSYVQLMFKTELGDSIIDKLCKI